ncbi:MFS transporter [Ruegeria arenilitoris]|uniref:MFS transporter n=1 Tax=Ruegeria arenilitoris TaxID=1173585 RepID=UPI001479DC12
MTQSFRIFLQVILLWVAGLGAATQFAKIAVAFDAVGALYPGYGDSIGWLLSIISLMGAVLGAMSGAITAQFGPVRLLVFGLLLGGVVSVFQSTIPGFHVMVGSRIIEGVSHLAIVVAAPTLIAQITRGAARNAAMVLWSSFFGVAFALNAWFGLPMIQRFGLADYFMGHGVLMALIAGLVALFPPKVPPIATEWNGWGLGSILQTHLETYRSPRMAAPAIGWFFYTLTFVSLLAILPGRMPEDQSVLVASLMPLAGIVLSWIAVPVLLTFLTAVTVVNLGFAAGMAALALLFFGAPLPVVGIALFAVLGLVQGGSFAAVPQLNGSARDQALSYGAMAQMGNAGNLLGTPVLLAILWRAGEGSMFVAVLVFYAAAIAAHLFLSLRRRSSPDDLG